MTRNILGELMSVELGNLEVAACNAGMIKNIPRN